MPTACARLHLHVLVVFEVLLLKLGLGEYIFVKKSVESYGSKQKMAKK